MSETSQTTTAALIQFINHTACLQSEYSGYAELFQADYVYGLGIFEALDIAGDWFHEADDTKLMYVACFLSLRELLATCGTHYDSLQRHRYVAETVKAQLAKLRRIAAAYDSRRIYEQITTDWLPIGNTRSPQTVVVLYIIWVLSIVRPHDDLKLYDKVNSCLSLNGTFLTCYLAAGCLKLENVNTVHRDLSQSDEQIEVMQLFSTFKDLPGFDW